MLGEKIAAAETLTRWKTSIYPSVPRNDSGDYRPGTRPGAAGRYSLAGSVERSANPSTEAQVWLKPKKPRRRTRRVEDALAGARDILAERMNDDNKARAKVRDLFQTKGVSEIESHQRKGRGRREVQGLLRMERTGGQSALASDSGNPARRIRGLSVLPHSTAGRRSGQPPGAIVCQGQTPCAEQVKLAVQDSYKRLLGFDGRRGAARSQKARRRRSDPRLCREPARTAPRLAARAEKGLGHRPRFPHRLQGRVLDRQGKLLAQRRGLSGERRAQPERGGDQDSAVVNDTKWKPSPSAMAPLARDGTIRPQLGLPTSIVVVMVSESGASIYSASDVARQEFPDQDVTVRGAVSIGRRLMDPLAELVKIDPKSIGVGQYQHDVDQKALKRSLDDVVMCCVNNVGVELNTARPQILAYVSGLNPQVAENIVAYRDENGPFSDRQQLLKVPRLGPKTFQQAAGFLRVRDGAHPLDASAVHPESYSIVDQMAADRGCTVNDLMRDDALRKGIKLDRYITEEIGLPTLNDILAELAKPGRDPRQQFEVSALPKG